MVRDALDPRRQHRYWPGADLVVEIVSPDNPERDTRVERADYAEAGIPEYWIVHPEAAAITVLTLTDDTYREHGLFRRGKPATSLLLPGFAVDVDSADYGTLGNCPLPDTSPATTRLIPLSVRV